MEDKFTRYSKLYILIFLLFLSIPVVLGLIFLAFYGFSKAVSSTIADVIFGLGIVSLTPAIFLSVYYIFLKRTKKHPAAAVKVVSQVIFVLAIALAVGVLVLDMIAFFTKFKTDISSYYGYSLWFTAGNIALLFIIAIIQAFTTEKEVDWMDRHR